MSCSFLNVITFYLSEMADSSPHHDAPIADLRPDSLQDAGFPWYTNDTQLRLSPYSCDLFDLFTRKPSSAVNPQSNHDDDAGLSINE